MFLELNVRTPHAISLAKLLHGLAALASILFGHATCKGLKLTLVSL